jgi:hypothetical protein
MVGRGWISLVGYWLGLAAVVSAIVCLVLLLHPGVGAAGGCGGG